MKIKRMELRVVVTTIFVFLLICMINPPINYIGEKETYAASYGDESSEVATGKSTDVAPTAKSVENQDANELQGFYIEGLDTTQTASLLSPSEYSFNDMTYTQNEILDTQLSECLKDAFIYQGLPEKSDILENESEESIESFSLEEIPNDDELLVASEENEGITVQLIGNDGRGAFNDLANIASNVIFDTETCMEYGDTDGIDQYAAINCNDNGAISIGLLQWHGSRAKKLILLIQKEDPNAFEDIIYRSKSGTIRSEIFGDSSWSRYTISRNSAKYDTIKEILDSSAGRKVQDELALKDVKSYLHIGIKDYNIEDPKALIYFADLTNQYGEYSNTVDWITDVADNDGKITLDSLYFATKWVTSQYRDRRKQAYNTIDGIDVPSIDNYIDNIKSD